MQHPTGRQVDIAYGPYAATITEVGATLRALTYHSRPLIAGFGEDEAMPEFRGAVLAPWPNRIIGGRYQFDGRTHQLPITEPGRNAALHGFVAWWTWRITSVTASTVQLSTVLYHQPGYLFQLTLHASYHLDQDGLSIEISARNDGPTDAPYGVSVHPWLTATDGAISDWTLTLAADDVLTIDQAWSPTGVQAVAGEYDYRRPRALADTQLDHTFTGLHFNDRSAARSTLLAADGSGVSITWDTPARLVNLSCISTSVVRRAPSTPRAGGQPPASSASKLWPDGFPPGR